MIIVALVLLAIFSTAISANIGLIGRFFALFAGGGAD